MIDQTGISISGLVKVPLKKSGRFLIGPCPVCGGTDRFNIKDDSMWMCRQCQPKYSDALTLVQRMYNVDFKAALSILNIQQQGGGNNRNGSRTQPAPRVQLVENASAWKTPEWQAGANALLDKAILALTPDTGAWEYLTERGLHDATIYRHQLGFIAEDTKQTWGETEVFLYRGIVIPWEQPGAAERYYRLNIRLSPMDTRGKYKQVAGGTNHGIYIAAPVQPNQPAVIVESEFDALLLKSELIRWSERTGRHVPPVGIVATGSTGGSHIGQWLMMLARASTVLVAFDVDENEAGERGAQFWLTNLPRKARRLAPTAHDITDMWKAGHNVVKWLYDGIHNDRLSGD